MSDHESLETACASGELTAQQARFLMDEVDRLTGEDSDLAEIESTLVDEIERLLSGTNLPMLNDMQPPTSIFKLAAEAAAKVIMAFERGYRMGD